MTVDRGNKTHCSLCSTNIEEVWSHRDLLIMLVKKRCITCYKLTIRGSIWFFVKTILSTKIYVFLSGQIAKLSSNGGAQIAFYFAGITFFFGTTTQPVSQKHRHLSR